MESSNNSRLISGKNVAVGVLYALEIVLISIKMLIGYIDASEVYLHLAAIVLPIQYIFLKNKSRFLTIATIVFLAIIDTCLFLLIVM